MNARRAERRPLKNMPPCRSVRARWGRCGNRFRFHNRRCSCMLSSCKSGSMVRRCIAACLSRRNHIPQRETGRLPHGIRARMSWMGARVNGIRVRMNWMGAARPVDTRANDLDGCPSQQDTRVNELDGCPCQRDTRANELDGCGASGGCAPK